MKWMVPPILQFRRREYAIKINIEYISIRRCQMDAKNNLPGSSGSNNSGGFKTSLIPESIRR